MVYNNNSNFIETIDFGNVPIRKNFTDGEYLDFVEACNGDIYEIKRDYTTSQLFAVLSND